MVFVPKGKPDLGTLNSFYVILDRLIEHCQGALGAGCLHLHTSRTQAAIFFEGTEVVGTCVSGPEGVASGPAALAQLLENVPLGSYAIDVFAIDPSLLHFWASLATAELVYSDLSAEFTDLENLIRKLEAEKLSGCLEVQVPGEAWGAILLLDEGRLIGGSYALGEVNGSGDLETLVEVCAEKGGMFQVSRLPLAGQERVRTGAPPVPKDDGPTLALVEKVLGTLEAVVGGEKSLTTPFSTLLRAKFLSKAAAYDFLDPFAGEFTYSNGTVCFVGDADRRLVARAIGECVTELAGELRLSRAFRASLKERFGARPDDLSPFGLAA